MTRARHVHRASDRIPGWIAFGGPDQVSECLRGQGARPMLVCRMAPVALMKGRERKTPSSRWFPDDFVRQLLPERAWGTFPWEIVSAQVLQNLSSRLHTQADVPHALERTAIPGRFNNSFHRGNLAE